MRLKLYSLPCVLLLLVLAGCSKKQETVSVDAGRLRMFAVLPATMESAANPLTEEKIALGRMLYYETRISRGHDISCNSCHDLAKFGVDNKPTSDGHKGVKGDRNSPTVYNAAGHFVQFWDGRSPDVEDQAKGPVLNPVEMAMPSDKHVLIVMNSIPEYVEAFKKAFPEDKNPVNYDNFGKAVGAFERKLVTPARWDKFLGGDQAALSDQEKAGLNKFIETGCATCHMGAYLGGTTYQKTGLMKPWPNEKDLGRFAVTKNEADRMMFKVPSLRNIEMTGPYFHDGSVASLEQAVNMMTDYQLGKQLAPEDTQAILAWLKSLTGELPMDYIKAPQLPPSTAKTPKPDMSD